MVDPPYPLSDDHADNGPQDETDPRAVRMRIATMERQILMKKTYEEQMAQRALHEEGQAADIDRRSQALQPELDALENARQALLADEATIGKKIMLMVVALVASAVFTALQPFVGIPLVLVALAILGRTLGRNNRIAVRQRECVSRQLEIQKQRSALQEEARQVRALAAENREAEVSTRKLIRQMRGRIEVMRARLPREEPPTA